MQGLAGKSTIDILVTVDNIDEVDSFNTQLESLGYLVLGEYVMQNARLFTKESNDVRLCNIHVFNKEHPHVKEMLNLRDYSRSHPSTVKEYSNLKFNLLKKYPDNYGQYRKYKDQWMNKLKEKIVNFSNNN